jgi:5'-3' exonuclease
MDSSYRAMMEKQAMLMVAVFDGEKKAGRLEMREYQKASQTKAQDGSGYVCMARRKIKDL